MDGANLSANFYSDSALIMKNQFTFNIVSVVLGVISVLMGSAQMSVILYSAPLRNYQHSLIFLLAFGDVLKGSTNGGVACRRVYYAMIGAYEANSQRNCLLFLLPALCSSRLVIASMIAISLDRFLALACPIWFFRQKAGLKILLIAGSFTAGIISGVVLMLGSTSDTIVIACTVTGTPHPYVRTFFAYTDNVASTMTMVINGASCTIVAVRLRKAVRENQNITVMKQNIQLNALKTLLMVNGLFLLSVYGSSVYIAVLNALPIDETIKAKYAPIGGNITMIRGVFDFPIYIFMAQEYREGSKKFFKRILSKFCSGFNKKTPVYPINVH